jgi:2-succinyl-6-hydroxy-2,4-cyclohexadiene-1-carboxylate synthase/o-succinylbenzoate synthase
LTEPYVARAVSRMIPSTHALFVSSSMPIRDLNFYSQGANGVRRIGCNRGAAGIDGVISTSIGFAVGAQVPTTLLIGDLATLHDTSALQHLQSAADRGVNMCIVVVNNSGGGIFKFLPIAKHDKEMYNTFFTTPQNVDFRKLVEAHHVTYQKAETSVDFENEFSAIQEKFKANASRGSVVVLEAVISTNGDENIALHKAIMNKIDSSVAKFVEEDCVPDLAFHIMNVGPRHGIDAKASSLVLLHGWMGSKEDWTSMLDQYPVAREVIVIDLPGCGDSPIGHPSTMTIEGAARAVLKVLTSLNVTKAVICGYSLGGRVAMAIANLRKELVARLVLIGANPAANLEDWQREERYLSDCNIAKKLLTQPKAEFLEKWYSAPIWADLKTRKPVLYNSWIASRRFDSEKAACTLLGCSLANQIDYSSTLAGLANVTVLVGELDTKFSNIVYPDNVARVVVPDSGHLLIGEYPEAIAAAFEKVIVTSLNTLIKRPNVYPEGLGEAKFEIITRHIPLTAPLPLSRGTITHRESALLLLNFDNGIVGVGELCPLPGWHKEDFSDSLEVLHMIIPAVVRSVDFTNCCNDTEFDAEMLAKQLSSSIDDQLREHAADGASTNVFPSVRTAIEMAFFHAVSQFLDFTYLSPRSSHVHINGLYTRKEGDDAAFRSNYEAIKIKVGSVDVTVDADKINRIARTCGAVKLRLDANQAWSLHEGLAFGELLTDDAKAKIEYIEEPILPSEDLLREWQEFSERTGLCVAVDESYYDDFVGTLLFNLHLRLF